MRADDPEAAQAPILAGLIAALSQTVGAVKRVDTQGAVVLLAGEEAYKLRRAVKLPFLDYSTLEKRRAASLREIEVNRDAAAEIYREVVAVTRSDGGFRLGGPGEAVEWATRMRRFDESATLDRLAESGDLDAGLLEALAKSIARMHARAPRREGDPALASLRTWIGQNREAFAAAPDLFDPAQAEALHARALAALSRCEPLLLRRAEQGWTRRCHGDLHLRNIARIEGLPVPFDAIEFDEAIATGDVLYDLAFTVMDLWERDLREGANRLLSGYLAASDVAHLAGLAAFPLFLSLRAAIRAKVEAANLAHLEGEARERTRESARRYFDFALRFLEPRLARLVAIGGLSGTGKSALAGGLAPDLGRPPGAVWLRSDVERKHLFGVDDTTPLPEGAYAPEVSRQIYQRLVAKARLALAAGHSVIVDAVCAHGEERAALSSLAADAGVDFKGIWLEAPLGLRRQRVESRVHDASDADAAVVARQRADPLADAGWREVDASGDKAATLAKARAIL